MKVKISKKNVSDCIKEFLSFMEIEKGCMPSTVKDYGARLRKLEKHLAKNDIIFAQDVATQDLRFYIQSEKRRGNLISSSVAKIVVCIRSFFNFLYTYDYIDYNPAKKLIVPKKRRTLPVCLTEDEIKKLIKTAENMTYKNNYPRFRKERNVMMIKLLIYTGLRRGELLNLKWDDIDFSKKTLTVRRGKGGKDRVIPLNRKLAKDLWEFLHIVLPLKSRAVLVSMYKKSQSRNSFVADFKRIVKASGIDKKISTHTLRHSFASILLEKKVNILAIQKLLGHADLGTTQIYLHIQDSDLDKAVETITF